MRILQLTYQNNCIKVIYLRFSLLAICFLLVFIGFLLFGSTFYIPLNKQADGSETELRPLFLREDERRIINVSGHKKVDDDAILGKLDTQITRNLCSAQLSCQFEQRHLPPFVQQFQKNETEVFHRLQKSTILVITFNRRNTYYVAPLVHALYGRMFAEVLYCGPSPNATDMKRAVYEYFDDPTFSKYFGQRYLSYQLDEPYLDGFGENNYFCFNLALQHIAVTRPGFQAEGVFILADDAIMSFWNLAFQGDKLLNLGWSYSLPFPKLVYNTETLNACDMTVEQNTCDTPNPWLMWPENYQQQTSNFYHELTKKASSSKVYARCLERISKRAKGTFRVLTGYADMFYVAKKDFQEAFAMFELASRNKVFQEVAVPTSFACFDPMTTGFIDDSGDNTNSNGVGRKSPWEAYDSTRLLTHPFKLSNIVKAITGDGEAKQSRMLGICLYCMLCQYSKYLSLLRLF